MPPVSVGGNCYAKDFRSSLTPGGYSKDEESIVRDLYQKSNSRLKILL